MEAKKLTKILTVIAEGQKNYGKEVSVPNLFLYFKLKLENRFTMEQVEFALMKYTDEKNDIPAPADIIAILEPKKPRISESQFIAAQKAQERNGYPRFSYEAKLIEEYEIQKAEDAEKFQSEMSSVQLLGKNETQKISNQIENKKINNTEEIKPEKEIIKTTQKQRKRVSVFLKISRKHENIWTNWERKWIKAYKNLK